MAILCSSASAPSLSSLSSVETAKSILKTDDLTFVSRHKTAAGKYTTYNYADITCSPYGPYWRQARKRETGSSRRTWWMFCCMQLADDPNLDVKLHRDGVKAFTQDLIAGGTESSATTVEWAISELLKRPHIFDKATEELDRVIGRDRWVDEKDMHTLPYIEAIVKETMRLHPVTPMLVPRFSREDSTIAGYDIPSGTLVLVNVWTIGRDPTIWDAPEEFRPEWFLGSSIDVKGHNFELLPFGAGRRMCPGYSLGLKVIQAMAAEELSMEEIFGLSTPRKVPLEVVVEAKLPAHLYGV